MKSLFSRKQLNKIVVDNYASDCQWAFCMVVSWAIVFAIWFSWLLLTG